MLDLNPGKWAPALREEWEERAGIIEESCRVDRATAERLATAVVRARVEGVQLPLFERAILKAAGRGRP